MEIAKSEVYKSLTVKRKLAPVLVTVASMEEEQNWRDLV